ncbi:MAG: gluconolaconase [Acidobacteriota bacterium]
MSTAGGGARFADPFGAAVATDGTLYVTEGGWRPALRAVTPAGDVVPLAGGLPPGFVDGPGSTARFDAPSALALDDTGDIYVADTGNNAIRRVTPRGVVSTLAIDAPLNGPIGIAVDAAGRVIVADAYNDAVRIVGPGRAVTTVTGPAEFPFDTPSGVAVATDGAIYVADTGNHLVRRIDPRTNDVVTLDVSLAEGLSRPIGIAAAGDALYVTEERGRLIAIDARGNARVVAGAGPGFRDGEGADARFRRPASVAVAGPHHLVVADAGNGYLRRVIARGAVREAAVGEARPVPAPAFDETAFRWAPLLWPVWPMTGPHEVAGTMGEIRGGAGSERFHAGVDIRADAGSSVHAVRDGIVETPLATGGFNTLDEWMRVGPLGYVHVRVGRDVRGTVLDRTRFVPSYDAAGRLTRVRVKRGARFRTGEVVGSVNRFNHVHLNVGWTGEEVNPLAFRLPGFRDTVAPVIPSGGVRLYDDAWQPLARRSRGRVVVSGRVRVVVEAWDRADGNRPGRRLGLHALGFEVLGADGRPVPDAGGPEPAIRFDRLLGSDAARLVYARGSGIPFYRGGVTAFRYIVTNRFRDGVATEGAWDTSALEPGPYAVRAWAADIAGNRVSRDLAVTVEAPD